MSRSPFTTFSRANRRRILLLVASHLLWSCALFGLWSIGRRIESPSPWISGGFVALQLYAAAQLILPALRLQPEERTRGFYLFWGTALAVAIWGSNQLRVGESWMPLLSALKSGLLLFAATVTGAALARYVRRLWEIVPICIAMTLADFASWRFGPTAAFTREIERYYLAPQGPPPPVDMILIKLAFPGSAALAPVFGISDWIMVVFFAMVANRHGVNDNLVGLPGDAPSRQERIGLYLPVPVAALFLTTSLAQGTGLFLPALPLIALTMLLWYIARTLLRRLRS